MPIAIGQANPSFVPEALSASNVGVWEWAVAGDVMRVDANCAALFGLPAKEAERGLPLKSATDAIHPEDYPSFESQLADVIRQGGLFVAEYRTCPRPGDVRWILARGRFETDTAGAVSHGRGIVIDITESKRDGHLDEEAVFLAMPDAREWEPLYSATDSAISAYRELEKLGAQGEPLLAAARPLLVALGRELAKLTPEHEALRGLRTPRTAH